MPIGFDKNAIVNTKKQPAGRRVASSSSSDGTQKMQNHTKQSKVNESTKSKAQESDSFDDDDFNIDTKPKTNKKMIYIALGIVGVLVIAAVYFSLNKSEQPQVSDNDITPATQDVSEEDTSTEFVYDENGNPIYSKEDNSLVDDNAIDPGAPDYNASTKNKTTSKVYKDDDYLKDINGVDIKATYNVISRDYVYDYVSYTAKRGIIDDGMEIYWLDAKYKGKKYRIQVPFYYFKDFDEQGVCRVQMEVLNIEGGGKVISYMQVVDNPSDDITTEE